MSRAKKSKDLHCERCNVLLGTVTGEHFAMKQAPRFVRINPAEERCIIVGCPGCDAALTVPTTPKVSRVVAPVHFYEYAGDAVVCAVLGNPKRPKKNARKDTKRRYIACLLAQDIARSMSLGVSLFASIAAQLLAWSPAHIAEACAILGMTECSEKKTEWKRLDAELTASISLCRQLLSENWSLVENIVDELQWLHDGIVDDVLVDGELVKRILARLNKRTARQTIHTHQEAAE